MGVKIEKGTAAGLVNLTPMIDVVFQLLLFFLVASRFADEERIIKMPLPQASEAKPMTQKAKAFTVNVDHEGKYYVDGKYLTRQALQQALLQVSVNNPNRQQVVIRTDKRCPVDYLVFAINACLRANLRNYEIATAENSKGG